MFSPPDKTFSKKIENVGTFVFRYTTLLDEISIDNEISTLLGGNTNPSVGAVNIATMVGTLKIAIVKAPEGFNLENLYCYDDLKEVYDAYTSTVSSFRTRQGNQNESPGGGTGV